MTDPRSAYWVTQYTYDAGNRVLSEQGPLTDTGQGEVLVNSKRQYRYDRLGRLVQSIDALNTSTWNTYDKAGQLLQQAVGGAYQGDPAGKVIQAQRYDTYGNKVRSLDGNNQHVFGVKSPISPDRSGKRRNGRLEESSSPGVVDPRSRAYRLVSRSSGQAPEGDRHATVRSH